MSDPAPAHPINAALRELGKVLHERYHLSARIARSYWPDETPADVLAAAVHTVFIELNKHLNGHHAPAGDRSHPAAEAPPCPKCGTVMQAVPRKSPKTPDFRCPDRACDTPLWLHKRNGVHS